MVSGGSHAALAPSRRHYTPARRNVRMRQMPRSAAVTSVRPVMFKPSRSSVGATRAAAHIPQSGRPFLSAAGPQWPIRVRRHVDEGRMSLQRAHQAPALHVPPQHRGVLSAAWPGSARWQSMPRSAPRRRGLAPWPAIVQRTRPAGGPSRSTPLANNRTSRSEPRQRLGFYTRVSHRRSVFGHQLMPTHSVLESMLNQRAPRPK